MKNFTFKLMAAFIAITAIAAVSGCTSTPNDIDLSIDSDVITEEENSTVDIRLDEETTAAATESEPEEVAEPDIPKEETSAATTTTVEEPEEPAVVITTDAPEVTTPAQTIRTDLPTVTAEPKYTTAATTTVKPAQTEPVEVKTDSNGFPANPTVNQYFVDSTGQEYIYDSLFGWIKGNNGNPTVVEFPSFEVEGGDEIILY